MGLTLTAPGAGWATKIMALLLRQGSRRHRIENFLARIKEHRCIAIRYVRQNRQQR